MKLATKKFFHNVLAIAVSVCMVCTLTPSVAWANSDDSFFNPDMETTQGTGNAGDDDAVFVGDGSGKAVGESVVKGKVYNVNFKFDTLTPGGNYKNTSDFKAVLDKNPLEAVFNKAGLPDKGTVTWYVQEVIDNPAYDPDQSPGPDNPKTILTGSSTPISTYTYTNPQETYEDDTPVFSYPGPGTTVQPNNLPIADGKMYEFSVVLKPEGSDEQASAKTKVTFLPDYPPIELKGMGDGVPNSDDYRVDGNIYVAFSIPMTYPQLSVSDVDDVDTNPVYKALKDEAANGGQDIGPAARLDLTDMDNLPEGQAPYLDGDDGEGLAVFIPLPEGSDAQVGSSVDVYGYNQIDGETAPSAKKYPGEVVELERANGSKYLAAAITIDGTGATLGSFAVGTTMGGSCTIYVSSTNGGMVNPGGDEDGIIENQPLAKEATFAALAYTTGFEFVGFEVRVGSANASPLSGLDVSGNLLKFNPAKQGVSEGGDVYVHAVFSEVPRPDDVSSAPAYNVSARLSSNDGASGEMTVGPAATYDGAPDSKSIRMNQSASLDKAVSDFAGVFLQFNPDKGCTIDYVRVNGGELAFDHSAKAVLIGALSGSISIEVGYKRLPAGTTEPTPTYVDVTGELDTSSWPAGYIRAMLGIDGAPSQTEFTHAYATPTGGTQTIQVFHTGNYRMQATQVDANGVETDVTKNMVTGDRIDSITLYNVTSPVTIIFQYIPKEAEIIGTTGPGGSGSVIIDPTQQPTANQSMKANAKMKARSVRAGSSVSIEGANQALEVGNRARITATPEAGYELGRVEINGTNVTQYFEPHYVGKTLTHLTMTVYRTETGNVPADAGRWLLPGYEDWGLYDNVTDKVLPIEGSLMSLVMTFNEKVPTSPTYQNIRTHVEGLGGTITPGFKVEKNTKATVQFFPDDTYKVEAYKIDNGSWKPVGDGPESLSCEVDVGEFDHDVTVRFTAGSTKNMPKSYTITPLASAGGAFSPGEPVKVYENDSFSFSVLPKTGYVMASQPELEGSGTLEVKGYTCTVKDVTSDCNLSVRFVKSDDTVDPTHVVKVRYNGEGGQVKPSSPFVVANGSDASFTFLPNDGWYVKGVYVVESTTPEADEPSGHGINLAGSVQQGRMFTLRDVQADTVLEVVFDRLDNIQDPADRDKNTPPALNPGDAFTLDPTSAAEIGEGATISPSLSDLTFVKEKDSSGNVVKPEHAAAGSDITIIIASGYELDGDSENGGITVKNGSNDVTDSITVKPAGDGLYEVKIPAENVTPDMKIVVNTKKDTASQGVINKATVNVSISGQGAITPAGIDGKVSVESGKSQTFSFIPAQGWKLHRVYVNDEAVSIAGNAYTIHNITGDETSLQAVFVEGQPDQPVVTRSVNVINDDSNKGSVTPSGLSQVADGAALSVLVEPKGDYKAVAYEGTSKTAGKEIPVVGNTIELANITADRTITVFFEPLKAADFLNLAVGYGDGGSVSPSGNSLVARGSTQTLSILPDAGKAVKAVWLTRGDNASGDNVSSSVRATSDRKGITYTTPAATEKMSVYVEFCGSNDPGRIPTLPTGDDLRDSSGNTTYHDMTAFVAGGGGTVLPTYAKVANNTTLTYTIVALDGYHVQSATYNGGAVSLSNNNTTYVTPAVTRDGELRVVFEKDSGTGDLEQYYTVFASAKSTDKLTTAGVKAGGSISPAGPVTVSGGGSQSFTIIPDPNCKVQSITISNISTGGAPTIVKDFTGSSYTLFSVSSDLNFTVMFTALDKGEAAAPTFMTHSINASSSLNGSISPAGARTVEHGGDAMYSFVPWDGYKLSYIVVDGLNIPASAITNMQYIFPNVTEDHTIHAVYVGVNEQATDFATVNVTSNRNGTVSPGGAILVKKGDSLTIDATPFLRYKITDIKYNSTSIASDGFDYTNKGVTGASLPYSWSNGQLTIKSVSDDSNVEVTFSEDKSSPTNPGEDAPDYSKVGATVSPAGTGNTSLQPSPIFIEKPPNDAKPDQKVMDVTIAPEDGKIADKIVVKYGNNTQDVYDATTTPSVKNVYETGCITVKTDRGDVDVDIHFRDKTGSESSYTPATFVEVNVTYSAGGMVGPSGTIKVAKGSNLTLQMIPNNNYEVASVTVDGANKTSEVYKDTRTYILKNVQTNANVNVGFGFVRSDEPEATFQLSAEVVNSDGNSGTVSPGSAEVRKGSNQVVYFLPAPGYKIGKVTVTRDGDSQEFVDYNTPSMAIRNIASDVNVQVEYVTGENSWSVKSVPLTVEVGAGKGHVSPGYAELPVGSAAEVNFYPDDEWMTAYYTLNGQTYKLPQNVSSWPVTPDPANGAENVMRVFFERYDVNNVDQLVSVKLVDSGDGQYHGSASPSQATVAYGGSTTFYVYPELNAANQRGYTIDYVRFNGVDQNVEGVMHAGGSDKQTYSMSNGSYGLSGMTSTVTESDADRLGKASNTYYNAYSVTLDDVVTSGTLEVKFKKIPNGTGTVVTTKAHKMTVTSIGGGMVTPIGEVTLPEGETLDILTTTFESYFLYSVIKTDLAGKVDLTGSVEGRVAKATMGSGDCTVEVTFNRINQKPEADVNVSLTKATYNGQDITADVEIGAYVDPDTGNLVPISKNEQGVLCDKDGNPISYVRGGSYEFYFSTSVRGENDRDLVLSSAKYDGKSQSIIPGANYLTNVVLNASGGFELEFRELEESEQPLNPAQGFYVYVQPYGPGKVTPPGPFTRQPGGNVEIAFEGDNDNIAVSSVILQYVNDYGEPEVYEVPAAEYATGTYRLSAIDRDYTIEVIFDEYSIVRVDWDNGLGFVTPNHAPGSYIYRPIGTESMDFKVAPYAESELLGVYVGESADAVDMPLETSDDPRWEEELKAELGLTDPEQGGITTMSMADLNTVVQPESMEFAQVYGVNAPLGERNTYLLASFKSKKNDEEHTISASVKGGHGTIDRSGDIKVKHGDDLAITAAADPGYTLVRITLDGREVSVQNPLLLKNVTEDHTVVFEFGLPQAAGNGNGADRLLRVASSLAQTGDLTGPVVGALLIVAALGLAVTAVSYIRRQQRRRRRMQGLQ